MAEEIRTDVLGTPGIEDAYGLLLDLLLGVRLCRFCFLFRDGKQILDLLLVDLNVFVCGAAL